MNEYIFDWRENCEYILKNRKYTTKSHQFMEQAVLFKYLSEQGNTKDEIFNFWLTTESQLLSKANGDEEDINFIFGKLWSASSYWRMAPSRKIIIYKEEIDFLNSLVIFDWLREYLLCLLCIYKYYGKEWCNYDSKIKGFCFSITKAGREREEHKQKIKECLKQYAPYSVSVIDSTVSFKINFIQNSGEELIILSNPREIEKALVYLKNEKTCINCGKVFTYSSQTIKNQLCPLCKKKQRHKQQYECHKKQQANAKIINMKDEN